MINSLTIQTLLKTAIGCCGVIFVSTTIGYFWLVKSFGDHLLNQLQEHTILRGERESSDFLRVEENQALLRESLLRQLQKNDNTDFKKEFTEKVVELDDGTIRNNPRIFDIESDPGTFLGDNVEITSEMQYRVVNFYEILSAYGPAWRGTLVNTYIQIPENGIVIYMPGYPWAQKAPSSRSFRVTGDESFLITKPDQNPERKTVWTGIYYDQVAGSWMTSCVTPVDVNGKHIGTIGNDILIDQLLQRTMDRRLRGTYNLIFREDGRLIANPEFIDQMKKDNLLPFNENSDLKSIFQAVKQREPDQVIVYDSQTQNYLAVTTISGPDWYLVTVMPRSFVEGNAMDVAKLIIILGLLSLLIEILFLAYILRHEIAKPLRKLMAATETMSKGDLDIQLDTSRKDELGRLAYLFNNMSRKLAQSFATLETRVMERTLQLEEAKEEAEESNRTKSAFLANMSHELRTPLNAIIGYSEMLAEEAQDLGEEDFVTDLNKIRSAGKHLLGLINDVLDISKIEAGKMDLYLENFEIKTMVEDVVSTIVPLINKNNNSLKLEMPEDLGSMYADLTKIRQCLFNLLSNASKFTEQGVVILSISPYLKVKEEWLCIKVTDSGIGMSQEQISRLFQAFSQADASTTRKYGGTGLGLTITKRFCEMMGGDIRVESEIGKGSNFIIELPTKVVDNKVIDNEATLPPKITTSENPSSKTILIIDDDNFAHAQIEKYFSSDRFNVIATTDPEMGLELAKKEHPDVIILDVIMPKIDGWTMLNRLKEDPDLRSIPVIMSTFVNDKNVGYALGATDYLIKPISKTQMKTILEKYVFADNGGYILIVDDEAINRSVLHSQIEKVGLAVKEATNGLMALEMVKQSIPQLILLDLMMPEMDGFELIDQLRQNPQYQNIPIVVITAKDLTNEDRHRLSGYVQNVLQKGSYSRKTLLAEVNQILDEGDRDP